MSYISYLEQVNDYDLPLPKTVTNIKEAAQFLQDICNHCNIIKKANHGRVCQCITYFMDSNKFQFNVILVESSSNFIIQFFQCSRSNEYIQLFRNIQIYMITHHNYEWVIPCGIIRGLSSNVIQSDENEYTQFLNFYNYTMSTDHEFMHISLYFDYVKLLDLWPHEPLFTIKCPYFTHILKNLFKPIHIEFIRNSRHIDMDPIYFILHQLNMLYRVLHLPYIIDELIHFIAPSIYKMLNHDDPFVQLYALKVAHYVHTKKGIKLFSKGIVLNNEFVEARQYHNDIFKTN